MWLSFLFYPNVKVHHSCYSNRQLYSPSSYFCPAQLIGFHIIGVQAAQWAVLQLFLFTIVDKISRTMLVVTTAATAFQNLMAEPGECE